jgi:hypothetical protein
VLYVLLEPWFSFRRILETNSVCASVQNSFIASKIKNTQIVLKTVDSIFMLKYKLLDYSDILNSERYLSGVAARSKA